MKTEIRHMVAQDDKGYFFIASTEGTLRGKTVKLSVRQLEFNSFSSVISLEKWNSWAKTKAEAIQKKMDELEKHYERYISLSELAKKEMHQLGAETERLLKEDGK